MARIFKHTYSKNGVSKRTRKYYIEYRDRDGKVRRTPGYVDKAATQQKARQLESDVAQRHVGMIDRYADHQDRPLTAHIDDWERTMINKGATEAYATLSSNRVRSIFRACGIETWPDITASKVLDYLADLRNGRVPNMHKGEYTDANPRRSVESTNHYLKSAKAFCKWYVQDGRAPESPVAHLKRANANVDRRHDRRALLADELRRLIEAAASGPTLYGIDGPDRAILYRAAAETGLRSSELRSLTVAAFNFDADTPTVTVSAAYSKHRREDVLPLRAALAAALRGYLADMPATASVFKMPSPSNVVRMLRADLAAARATWIGEAMTADERHRREDSTFLSYRDDAGRVADFHSLRHSFVSALARGGVHPRVAQSLARHSTITLTMDVYSHTVMGEQSTALETLPTITSEPARATGTHGGRENRR